MLHTQLDECQVAGTWLCEIFCTSFIPLEALGMKSPVSAKEDQVSGASLWISRFCTGGHRDISHGG